MIARTARMFDHVVYFPIGIDRNGLPVELYTEKKYKISMINTPREKFIELCKHALDDLEAQILEIMKVMGMSGDFANYYRTDSEEYRKLTQSTFIKLWKDGMVYQSKRPNNYCVDCRTTLADADVVYEEIPSQLVFIKFKVKETAEEIPIATTRPELLSSCRAVIVNPEDGRYAKLHGRTVITPIFNREVKLIPHPSAKQEFGSGAVMICSYGDYTDVLMFRELDLQETISIDIDGRMTETAAQYKGLKAKQARQKIIEDMEALGLITKKESLMHRTPLCERSNTPIEIISMDEYYLKQLDHKEQVREAAKKLIFHPENHRRILLDWIDSISFDWPISRRRFYGTEIPVWYCKSCNAAHVPDSDQYYQPWKQKAPFEKCSKCGGTEFIGDQRTFDTWMDSSITPLFATKYSSDKELHSATYPTALRPQAKDIIRTWLYYTVLRCLQLTGKSPFEHAWIMGYGVDEKGEKMSKSKGNVIDPMPILKKYGADTFRLWAASESSLGSDFRVSEVKIAGIGKFVTKLWNVSRFISNFPYLSKADITPTDKWILSELFTITKEAIEGYRDYNFFVPANKVREFLWNVFAPNYVEMVKQRAYGEGFNNEERDAAHYTLHTCLRVILLLLAPITPFVTDKIWTDIYNNSSIHTGKFPSSLQDYGLSRLTQRIVDFNSHIWNAKREKGLSLRDKIAIEIPQELNILEKDLKAMHNF
jgi:valyl-tRNA synthetase